MPSRLHRHFVTDLLKATISEELAELPPDRPRELICMRPDSWIGTVTQASSNHRVRSCVFRPVERKKKERDVLNIACRIVVGGNIAQFGLHWREENLQHLYQHEPRLSYSRGLGGWGRLSLKCIWPPAHCKQWDLPMKEQGPIRMFLLQCVTRGVTTHCGGGCWENIR